MAADSDHDEKLEDVLNHARYIDAVYDERAINYAYNTGRAILRELRGRPNFEEFREKWEARSCSLEDSMASFKRMLAFRKGRL